MDDSVEIKTLLTSALADARRLAELQLRLFQAELRLRGRKAILGAGLCLVALGGVFVALVHVALFGPDLLRRYTGLAEWQAHLALFGAWLAFALVVGWTGWKLVERAGEKP